MKFCDKKKTKMWILATVFYYIITTIHLMNVKYQLESMKSYRLKCD